jgi:Zinc carboxypeptidase/Chitobiase/beta-hexosaminidase C-terminal domain
VAGRSLRRFVVAALAGLVVAGSAAASAAAEEARGIDPNQGDSLVEVNVASKGAAMRLQLEAEKYGIEFNEHYLRSEPDGSVTVTVFGSPNELAALEDAGFDVGVTIEGPKTWRERVTERQEAVRAERRADAAALGDPVTTADATEDELVILRADYFETHWGRFLSVEAKTRLATVDPDGEPGIGTVYTGPELSLSWNRGAGTPIDALPRTMNVNIDPDTTPDTYIEHRELIRLGDNGSSDPPAPTRIRVGSSTGAAIEGDVQPWLGGGLPPMGDNFVTGFSSRYLDPSEIYAEFDKLAAEYPRLAELITLPHLTNGYQRRAQAMMHTTRNPGSSFGNSAAEQAESRRAVVLTSRAWGHEGGNDLTAEFAVAPTASAQLTVAMNGNDLLVTLGTDAEGAASSTAQQVIAAINAHPEASAKLVATPYRRATPSGIPGARAKVSLSDFLDAPARVPRGPYQYSVMRIGKERDGSKVGVFLYCQQHAREWATPLTCLETASQLLTNYAVDERTRELVNTLDIFILPVSNPDGGHYSHHDFNFQRRNMTNHCVVGGQETDDANAANFWQFRSPPPGNAAYIANDPAARDAWGVDLNRNNTFGTIFDTFGGQTYIGASHSCTSDVYTGPGEASEPEIKNELWIADTFDNIKFSNNIHSFGGYFMWAPGTYLTNRDEGDAVHANIGVEKYFFAAGDQILRRIEEVRDTVILPERTGPIADVLYSAAGNSADEHWYNRGVIAYSFETGADLPGAQVVQGQQTTVWPVGSTQIRVSNRFYFNEGDQITIGSGANAETVTVASVTTNNTLSPQPNMTLATPLMKSHAPGEPVSGGASQVGVGFIPAYAEGRAESLEFAAGNFGLLESAVAYARDKTQPKVEMTGPYESATPVTTTFRYVNEPSVIRYTMDGSAPTASSPLWDSTGPREPGQTFTVTETTTFRWRAEDLKGNVSYGKRQFKIG